MGFVLSDAHSIAEQAGPLDYQENNAYSLTDKNKLFSEMGWRDSEAESQVGPEFTVTFLSLLPRMRTQGYVKHHDQQNHFRS